MSLFVLFESSIGYALFKLKDFDEANMTEKNVQTQIADFQTFSQMAKIVVISFIYIRPSSHLSRRMLPFLSSTLPFQARLPKNSSISFPNPYLSKRKASSNLVSVKTSWPALFMMPSRLQLLLLLSSLSLFEDSEIISSAS